MTSEIEAHPTRKLYLCFKRMPAWVHACREGEIWAWDTLVNPVGHGFNLIYNDPISKIRLHSETSGVRTSIWIWVVVVQLLSWIRPCSPMDCSMPGSSVLHRLLELAQIHCHWCCLTISSSVAPFAFNLSQHLSLFHELALRIWWP